MVGCWLGNGGRMVDKRLVIGCLMIGSWLDVQEQKKAAMIRVICEFVNHSGEFRAKFSGRQNKCSGTITSRINPRDFAP